MGVPTGAQNAPFFQLQTPSFALIAVDTGVLRGVDVEQLTWLRAALEASRGKMVMAVLGHPFFAGGHDVAHDDEEFMAVRDLLRAHGVRVVMAGDTHDLEHYQETMAARRADHRAPLGEWRRRRVFELWIGAGVARPARSRHVGLLSESGQRRREDRHLHAVVEVARLGVDAELRGVAVVCRMAVCDVRLQRGPVLPELRRRDRRAGGAVIIRPWGIRGPLTWSDFDRSASVMPPGSGRIRPSSGWCSSGLECMVGVGVGTLTASTSCRRLAATASSAFVSGLSGFGG